MPTPFISDLGGIDLSAFTRYLRSTQPEVVERDCEAWGADPKDALALGDMCRHMLGWPGHARAFFAWALGYLEAHPEAAREYTDLAARYAVLGDLSRWMSDRDGAMEAWAKAIDHGSDDPVTYLRLALALEATGRLEEARARIDGLFALPAGTVRARLHPEQLRLAEELRAKLPVALTIRRGQDLRTRVRELLFVAGKSYGRYSGGAEQTT